ncbi:MAG: MATE family efflux transporter [Clostridia bacterium]|nr:MATE family efflux transporter [Clostridia bacterium]
MKKRNVDMLSGSIVKGLLILALPIMVMNVMQIVFGIIDMTVLKTFSSDSAVGAVGASGSLITLCTSLLIGISVGANIVVAKRIGLGNKERVKKATMTALLFSVLGGLLLMTIGAVFAEAFLKMTNCPDTLLKAATTYFRIYFYGIPFLMLYNFCAAIMRAAGDTKRPMYFLILGGIVKVAFTLLFVAVFDMGVKGVSIATNISSFVICLLAFFAVAKTEALQFELKKLGLYGNELKEMLYIGVPSGLQTAMYSFANVVIMTVVNSFGENATTGVSIANQFDGIMYQIIYAPSLAAIPYVAQNIGAGNLDRVKKTVLRATLITASFGLTFGLLSAFFSAELSSIMSTTPEVIKYSQQKMIIVSSTYFLFGINEIMGGALKGMGKPIIPAVSTMVFMCLIRFPWVHYIFPLYPNLTFLYLIWPIGWISSIITLLLFYFPAMGKLKKKLTGERELCEATI